MKFYSKHLTLIVLYLSLISCQNFGRQSEIPEDFEGKIVAIYREYQTQNGEKIALSFKDKYTFYVKGNKLALIFEQLPNPFLYDSLVAEKWYNGDTLKRNWHTKYKKIYDLSQNKTYFFYLNPDDIANNPLASQSISVKQRYSVQEDYYEKIPLPKDIKIKNLNKDSTIMGYHCDTYEIRTAIPDGHPDIVQKVWISPTIRVKNFPHLDRGLNPKNGDLNNSWMLDDGLCMYMEADVLSKDFFMPLNNVMIWQVTEVSEEEVPEKIFKIPKKHKNGEWK